jgi:hypothetical protein
MSIEEHLKFLERNVRFWRRQFWLALGLSVFSAGFFVITMAVLFSCQPAGRNKLVVCVNACMSGVIQALAVVFIFQSTVKARRLCRCSEALLRASRLAYDARARLSARESAQEQVEAAAADLARLSGARLD